MTRLFLTAEAVAGSDIRDDVLPEMTRLAQLTGCAIEVRGNGTRFVAYPEDTTTAMQAAFDRLYPASTYVSVATVSPAPRPGGGRYQAREFIGFGRNGWRVMDTKHSRWATPRTTFENRAQAQLAADELNAAGEASA